MSQENYLRTKVILNLHHKIIPNKKSTSQNQGVLNITAKTKRIIELRKLKSMGDETARRTKVLSSSKLNNVFGFWLLVFWMLGGLFKLWIGLSPTFVLVFSKVQFSRPVLQVLLLSVGLIASDLRYCGNMRGGLFPLSISPISFFADST